MRDKNKKNIIRKLRYKAVYEPTQHVSSTSLFSKSISFILLTNCSSCVYERQIRKTNLKKKLNARNKPFLWIFVVFFSRCIYIRHLFTVWRKQNCSCDEFFDLCIIFVSLFLIVIIKKLSVICFSIANNMKWIQIETNGKKISNCHCEITIIFI